MIDGPAQRLGGRRVAATRPRFWVKAKRSVACHETRTDRAGDRTGGGVVPSPGRLAGGERSQLPDHVRIPGLDRLPSSERTWRPPPRRPKRCRCHFSLGGPSRRKARVSARRRRPWFHFSKGP